MSVEVKRCGGFQSGCHRSEFGVRIFIDGIEYAHEHRPGGSISSEYKRADELLRTAERWRKSEHGEFLVLKNDAAPGGRERATDGHS